MEEEIEVIQSEYELHILDDTCRINQLKKYLSIENHPFRRFFEGKLITDKLLGDF